MRHRTAQFRRTQLAFALLCTPWLWLTACRSGVGDARPATAGDIKASGVPVAAEAKMAVDESAKAGAPAVRQNVSDFVKDPDLVAAYRKAVAAMRDNGSADPSTVKFRTSLLFWANTHGYFGNGGRATSFKATVDRRLPQCLKYFQAKPYMFSEDDATTTCWSFYDAASQEFAPDKFSEGIWGTCQHTPSSCQPADEKCKEQRATPRFLPWHRLYLYYYERTVRKYSGSEAFALPYWDYFDYPAGNSGNGPANLWLPPLVTDGGSTAANTFYDPLRTLWLNEQKTSMTPDNASAKDAFAEPTFLDFSNTLEGVPHGAMHCATGNGCTAPHIGWVPVAGNDPVFYMHHANIDRLWQCWMNQKAAGATIDLEWAKANLGMPDTWYEIRYDFADENGQRVTKTIADAFSPEVLAVHYAEEVDCRIDSTPTDPLPTSQVLAAVDDDLAEAPVALRSDRIDLTTRTSRVELRPEIQQRQDQEAARDLLESVGPVSSGVWLVLENIVVKEAPAYTYNVYISAKDQPENRALVTRFSFFGFGDHGDHAHEGPTSLGTRRYYLNDDIHEIGITSAEDITVQFEPTNAVTGEPMDQDGESLISIESVRLIVQPGSD